MSVRFTLDALEHIAAIHAYIEARNVPAATRVVGRIRAAAFALEDMPQRGRAGAVPNTREWVVRGLPYIIVYEADESAVVVLGVYHGAQLRPGQEPTSRDTAI